MIKRYAALLIVVFFSLALYAQAPPEINCISLGKPLSEFAGIAKAKAGCPTTKQCKVIEKAVKEGRVAHTWRVKMQRVPHPLWFTRVRGLTLLQSDAIPFG
jgi:hypothetical protein